jgi:antitoxin HicB
MVAEELIRHYLAQPYRITVTYRDGDSEQPWLAAIEELAGCKTQGASAEEAVSQIPHALAAWVAGAQAAGREVPEPRDARQYSGKLLVRMPQSLHSELAHAAELEHVSLNAYINGVLAAASNWRQTPPDTVEPPVDVSADRADERRQRLIVIAVTVNLVLVTILTLALLASALWN